MNTATQLVGPSDDGTRGSSSGERLGVVRSRVRDLLAKSDSFRALPPDQQREIARHTVEVVNYISSPEGIPADRLARLQRAASRPAAAALAGEEDIPDFKAQGAREGAAVAGALLQAVNFPQFVSALIEGVFTSIVDSSIKQMEAYGNLVKSVAQTLNQFRDENVSMNQGRDHLVEQFPDSFMIDVDSGDGFDEGRGPRVRLRDGADENAVLQQVNSLPIEGGPLKSLDLDDDATENRLVQAARTQLATSRQQLLATMVLMGINRIIVTDGKISAKVMYDFRAQDNFKFRRSATKFDYDQNLKKRTSEGQYESNYQSGEADPNDAAQRRNASYYAKGAYRYAEEPVMTLASASQASVDAALQTKAQLAGSVEVNFKSETFPLEKMADSFQIGQIQNASRPRSSAQAAPPAGVAGAGTGALAPAAPSTAPASPAAPA